MGVLVDRIHRELTAEEIKKVSDCYHAWKSKAAKPAYADEPGFCKSVKLEEIQTHDYVLTPGRYVGAEEIEDDGEPFEQKMKRLTATLEEQFAESAKLEKAIRQNLSAFSVPVYKLIFFPPLLLPGSFHPSPGPPLVSGPRPPRDFFL